MHQEKPGINYWKVLITNIATDYSTNYYQIYSLNTKVHYLAPLVLLCVSVELYFSASGFVHTSSSSSSCEATVIVELIILSFHVGSVAGGKREREKKKEKSFGLMQSGDPWHKCVDGLSLNDFLGQVIPVSDGSRQEWSLGTGLKLNEDQAFRF